MKSCWYLSRALPDTVSGMGVRQIFKIRPVLKPDIFLSARRIYSLIVLITLWISCVSPMHRKNINHMKHYVVMKEVHRIAPALASLLRRRKNRNFCTQWVQAVQCTAALFCTYYSGPVCAIPYFSTRFNQNYVKFCFATSLHCLQSNSIQFQPLNHVNLKQFQYFNEQNISSWGS